MKLEVKPIPVPASSKHPPVPNDILPQHEFTPKGSGKTTVIANLLRFYKGYFHNIIVFSPTVASDEKWDWVKTQKLLTENKPLKEWVRKQSEEKDFNQVVQPMPVSKALEGLVNVQETDFDGLIKEKYFLSEYSEETLVEIMDEQMTIVKELKKHKKSKHLANRF